MCGWIELIEQNAVVVQTLVAVSLVVVSLIYAIATIVYVFRFKRLVMPILIFRYVVGEYTEKEACFKHPKLAGKIGTYFSDNPEREKVKIYEDYIINTGEGAAFNIKLLSIYDRATGDLTKDRLETWPEPIDSAIGPHRGGDLRTQINVAADIDESQMINEKSHMVLTYTESFGRKFRTVFENSENKVKMKRFFGWKTIG